MWFNYYILFLYKICGMSEPMEIKIIGYETANKTAKRSGNSTSIYLPNKWAGKKVLAILLEPSDD